MIPYCPGPHELSVRPCTPPLLWCVLGLQPDTSTSKVHHSFQGA
ncbi:unnamed protein product, partial [Staurois parvus]